MSTFSIPRLFGCNDVNDGTSTKRNSIDGKYATLTKCNSLSFNNSGFFNTIRRNSNELVNNLNQQKKSLRLQRCQSDAFAMQAKNSINRNGTIARNQFRGIRRDILAKHTDQFIQSMTVSTEFYFFV